MPQSKERHAEWMRGRRGAQTSKVHNEGAQNWETSPLEDIKSNLPRGIVSYILSVGEKFGNTEQRLRRAYKYQVWHDKNFINGVHRDLLEVTK